MLGGPGGGGGAERLRAVLLSCRQLAPLPPDVLHLLVQHSRLRTFEVGDVLFRAGEQCEAMYVVGSGAIAARFTSERGDVADLGLGRAGDLVGYLEVLDRGRRRCQAVALGPALVAAVPAPAARAALRASPQVLHALTVDLVRIVNLLTDAAVARTFESAPVRLAMLLLDIAGDADRVDFDGRQTLLAQRIGVTRQTLNRSLRALADQGLVTLHAGGRAATLDRRRLAAFIRASGYGSSQLSPV